jgi:hypothetical protein
MLVHTKHMRSTGFSKALADGPLSSAGACGGFLTFPPCAFLVPPWAVSDATDTVADTKRRDRVSPSYPVALAASHDPRVASPPFFITQQHGAT